MFSSVGWVELAIIFVVALLVIGPERLPGLIKELRAIMLAVRNAVGEARQQLDGEFGEEIREFSKPLAELNSVRQMGARGFITKTLFDGDESYLNSFDETKNQFRETVESVRTPNLRDTLRGAGAGTQGNNATNATSNGTTPSGTHAANTTGAPAATFASGPNGAAENSAIQIGGEQNGAALNGAGGVEVTQQAAAGESRAQVSAGADGPVQQAADHLAGNGPTAGAGGGAAEDGVGGHGQETANNNPTSAKNTGGASGWDDVI